ncbi:MAG TPA: xanthine dehydrogenase family protein molybdopterin-binding subunit [Chloroflexota bacterium]|nr:xanthine dehydrogenase family protein molybdopterin-binding subunit [Chloroflexota bacterium]
MSEQWLGQSVRRKEDVRLISGHGRFIDDSQPAGAVRHAAILRSPHAHARILGVTASQALQAPGVIAVLTPEDVLAWANPFPVGVERPPAYYPLATDRARFAGEPVAVVVARTRYEAEDALDLIEVAYEPLDAVVDPERALATDAPILHEQLGTNIGCEQHLTYGEPDEVFAQADVTLKRRFRFPKFSSTPMETYGVVAAYDPFEDSFTIWSNFQGPFAMHSVIARALKVPEHRLRLIVPADSGGGFGIKNGAFPYMTLIALAARKAGTPVKWIEDRGEHLAASSSGTDRVADVEIAATRDGHILGLRGRLFDNVGAYIRAPEPGCLFRPVGNWVGPYTFKALDFECLAVMTNKSMTGPNRGYGCGHAYFQLERLVDLLAAEVGLDPAEVRRRNMIPAGAFPYVTPSGGCYDSGDYQATFDLLLEQADYGNLRRAQQQARAEGRLVGIGLATTVDPSVSNMGYVTMAYSRETRAKPNYLPKSGATDMCQINVDPAGNFTVTINTAPQGQGHETVVAQLLADKFGLRPEDVRVVASMDTAERGWSISSGNYSSRFAATTAGAVASAADRVADKLVRIAAQQLETTPDDIELVNGRFQVKGVPERQASIRRLAGLVHWQPTALPQGMDAGLEASGSWSFQSALPPDDDNQVNSSQTYGFSAELALVEVDRETGEVVVQHIVSVHDAGKLLNPSLVDGQVHGSVVHGLGGALLEDMAYGEDGQFLAASFMDYLCPLATEVPTIETGHFETPSPNSRLGAKGIGEASAMSVPVLIANAVADALAPLGVEVTELPLSPNKVRDLIRNAAQSVNV